MFDHLTIRVRDLEASRRFYELALGPPRSGGGGFVEWGDFGIAEAAPGKPATRNLHVGFAAPDRAHVEEWWERLTQAGHPDDGRPGVRPEYKPSYYGAFVIDPDGNSAESVHHDETPFGRAVIDHLWLRSDHLDAAERFYSLVAPLVGHRIVRDSDPDSVRVTDGTGSFSFVGDGG